LAGGTITGISNAWKYFDLRLNAREAGDPKAQLRLTTSGKGTIWLDMVSVLPARTWKGHGLRPDLCEMLVGLQPAFNRFPGGCWVEGDDMAHMYQWKRTIGNIDQRTPLYNIWGYHATHGLGFHEYLQLSEDLGAEPLFCINVGMSHREVVPMEQMGQWVQDALDALEYANGPTNSVWGGLRAKNGHPAPFNLKYLEIGNENGGPAYNERWPLFVKAIREKYPEVKLIANHWGGRPADPEPEIVDEHYYDTPEFFMRHASHYDRYDRNGPKIFVGEYAVTRNCGLGNLRGAVGEAAFMTGLERNSDVVIMASYAPLFVNLNHRRWNPDLINFDSSRVYGLPSYYVQQMFSVNRGDVLLPVNVEAPETTIAVSGGAVGVGTWRTRAEYKDLKVVRDGQTVFEADFADGLGGWKRLGDGDWSIADGALRQSSLRDNVRAVAGNKTWRDYTYSLKARKISGDEGFLILFNVQDEEQKSWWNLGGWGNTSHAIESGGISSEHVNGSIDTGRWYDIRIETSANNVKCYLDGKLVHDVRPGTIESLYATAARDEKAGEIIIKAVNASADPLVTQLSLKGVRSVDAAKAIVLTSEQGTDENTINNPTKVSPKTHELKLDGPQFQHEFPGNSVTVFRIKPGV
jgi:alpha-L-arabinofuranosidase